MEYIDVLNPDGTKTGVSVPKKQVHDKGLWHRASHVWFVNSNAEILLQLRSGKKENGAGQYDISAAGHLSAGDEPL